MGIDWNVIEKKWQRAWSEAKIFEANPRLGINKFFITIAFPYPNMPLHIGHGRPFTLTDVYARFKRMQGFNVLFPMAFHYTGTPVLAIAKRIAANDQSLLDDLTKIYKVPPDVIRSFISPLKIAAYFRREMKENMKDLGYSIDWRREFTTIDPQYCKFIEWQFHKLRSKGLVTKGSHPVGWCPNCGSPMGQHDTQGDVEPNIGELTLIKFRFGDAYLLTGTLRPETIFGVTNIWVRPDVEYVKAEVDGEIWIISKEYSEKLTFMNRKVYVVDTVSGKTLLGQYATNPLIREKIPILPAIFIDPKNATGIVMSVPGHAPYDYIALEDLKKAPQSLLKLGLKVKILEGIKPRSLIALDGYSEFPALDILKQLGAKNQLDAKVEEATKNLYSQEFHKGKMKENTGKYAGMTVSEAREKIYDVLILENKAERLYTLVNRPIYCRCGTEIVVKVLEDQWFINYGDHGWKEKAHECLSLMKIVPNDLRTEFKNVIDWLRVKACARKQGMGTRLPWDKEWIIESLSDSVIYMSYYTIAKHIYGEGVKAEQLNNDVFDYIFLGEGDFETVARSSLLSQKILKDMREEFTYFYPLDSRNSGRDLVPNHLTFFIFNHSAFFSKNLWPKQIVVTGSVLMEGKKMSKSLGNIIPLKNAIADYGADPFRLAILSTSELLQDADFNVRIVKSVRMRLERFYNFAYEVMNTKYEHKRSLLENVDRWLLSRLQLRIKAITEAMNSLRMREALHEALYMLDQDIQWYLKRTSIKTSKERKKIISQVLREVLETRVLLLAPFTPHLCEEIWHEMGNTSFVTMEEWPTYCKAKVDIEIIEQEEFIKILQGDTAKIIQATKLKPKSIYYYTSAKWKWQVYLSALELAKKGDLKRDKLMEKIMINPKMREKAKKILKFSNIIESINKMPTGMIDKRLANEIMDEFKLISDFQDFYMQIFDVIVKVFREEDQKRHDPMDRARLAEPYRPAIYIEW